MTWYVIDSNSLGSYDVTISYSTSHFQSWADAMVIIAEEEIQPSNDRQEANEKAEATLRSVLTDEQKEQLDLLDSFIAVSESGKRYRIKRGRAQNIEELGKDDLPVAKYCVHPVQLVPDADTMLVQKLLIECDEELFLRTANKS